MSVGGINEFKIYGVKMINSMWGCSDLKYYESGLKFWKKWGVKLRENLVKKIK